MPIIPTTLANDRDTYRALTPSYDPTFLPNVSLIPPNPPSNTLLDSRGHPSNPPPAALASDLSPMMNTAHNLGRELANDVMFGTGRRPPPRQTPTPQKKKTTHQLPYPSDYAYLAKGSAENKDAALTQSASAPALNAKHPPSLKHPPAILPSPSRLSSNPSQVDSKAEYKYSDPDSPYRDSAAPMIPGPAAAPKTKGYDHQRREGAKQQLTSAGGDASKPGAWTPSSITKKAALTGNEDLPPTAKGLAGRKLFQNEEIEIERRKMQVRERRAGFGFAAHFEPVTSSQKARFEEGDLRRLAHGAPAPIASSEPLVFSDSFAAITGSLVVQSASFVQSANRCSAFWRSRADATTPAASNACSPSAFRSTGS